MKFVDQTGVTELITLTKTALKPLEALKSSITDVNGIVKSNGSGGFSAAAAGTDYAAASHTHSYLPLSGGTLTGALTGTTLKLTNLTDGGDDKWLTATSAGQLCYRTSEELHDDMGIDPIVVRMMSNGGVGDEVSPRWYQIANQVSAGRPVHFHYNGIVYRLTEYSDNEQHYFTDKSTGTGAIFVVGDYVDNIAELTPVYESDLPTTGILKKSSAGITAAVAGTDYAAADHSHSYLPLSGGTLTGNLTGQYITGTWLQTTSVTDKAGNFATIDGDGWIYYRTPAETVTDLDLPNNTSIRATTSKYGMTKLSNSTTSTSTSLAATPRAVKNALDAAKAYTDAAITGAINSAY